MIPKTIKLETAKGDKEVTVDTLMCVQAPAKLIGHPIERIIRSKKEWKGHCAENVERTLQTWTFPKVMNDIQERVEMELEDGLPDQKRTMLRNQTWGSLDERYCEDISLGYEIEKPWQRWSRAARDTCRVAICIDSLTRWTDHRNVLASKVALAAGLASALEALDYEVSVIAARTGCGISDGTQPRQAKKAYVAASEIKGEEDTMTHSNFAGISDGDIVRLISTWRCWDTNSYSGSLTNREWRDLCGDADLFIHISGKTFNVEGMPIGMKAGMQGDNVLSLDRVNGFNDMDQAIEKLIKFFNREEA